MPEFGKLPGEGRSCVPRKTQWKNLPWRGQGHSVSSIMWLVCYSPYHVFSFHVEQSISPYSGYNSFPSVSHSTHWLLLFCKHARHTPVLGLCPGSSLFLATSPLSSLSSHVTFSMRWTPAMLFKVASCTPWQALLILFILIHFLVFNNTYQLPVYCTITYHVYYL